MPNINDYHAYMSTRGSGGGGSGGGSGGGASGGMGCLTWIAVGLAILWLVSKLG